MVRGSVLVACAALVVTTTLGTASDATADPGDSCPGPGVSLRYLVLFDRGTPERDAASAIENACGEATGYYPEIGVAVATSASPEFAGALGDDRAYSAQAERDVDTSAPAASPTRPGPIATGGTVPAADLTGEQWDMRAVRADLARAVDPGSADVAVAVLDSGIDAAHPDLAHAVDESLSAGCLTGVPEQSEEAWAPTASPHGTHVAGIVAAADDGKGIAGVAPGVRLASVKVIDDQGYVDPEAAVCGLMWAARNGIEVANSSFSVTSPGTPCTSSKGQAVIREALARAVEYADEAGTLNVAAATNGALDVTPSPASGSAGEEGSCEVLPAGLRETIAVSAVDHAGVKAGYSSYGLGVIDLTAPGGEGEHCVLSTVPGGYEPLCGTSMAAPHVSGVAALLASARPGATPAELREALGEQAEPVACPEDYDLSGNGMQDAYCAGYLGYNGFYGRGIVDAFAAVSDGEGSPEQEPREPAGRPVDPEDGEDGEVRDVPDHARVQDADREPAHQLDGVVQGKALHGVLQGLGIDRQWVEGR
ncbi:serine protease [Prauserella coralliicola]|nr:serine protease [Prauserella coralliicola]